MRPRPGRAKQRLIRARIPAMMPKARLLPCRGSALGVSVISRAKRSMEPMARTSFNQDVLVSQDGSLNVVIIGLGAIAKVLAS